MLKTEDEYRGSGGNGWGAVICEACERCPAEFICKADAASLCAACDAEIHSANPLARRHQRVPISRGGAMFRSVEEEDEEEAASWLLMNPGKNNDNKNNNNNNNNGMFLLSGEDEEDDEYLKFVEFNGNNEEDDDEFETLKNNNYGGGGDSVVPIDQFEGNKNHDHHLHHHHHEQQQQNHEILLEQSYGGLVDASEFFHTSSKPSFSYNGFLTHAISVSSMEVGVVPESTATIMSDISISNMRPPKGTIDLFSGMIAAEPAAASQMPAAQLSPMDREARVLRYREKKKTRKFEKTIRYASRKAYAETRPRIKGRFAKRTDVEVQLDRKYSNPLMPDAGYGIVPSF
ncbi:zinc finger protein CONSTANS-LIKE 2 [Cucumis sativus]|uniref:Uncharacterized protein n=1 Tax=Cucumis sativus TaxID=3659 RepID=A0A0A0KY36_CUCSA|nr:zinc finger protein CONSTANS-LIKE 2 [Cucumis sativus]KGN53769.1 hypothetical protein Csa_015272 [Cucumis sativus]